MDASPGRTWLMIAAMLLVAVAVLFLLPPAANGSERAFRLVVAIAAILGAALKWRRLARTRRDLP